MPVLRNISLGRHSGGLKKQTPVIYDGSGWPTSESIKNIPNNQASNHSMLQCPVPTSVQYIHACQQEQKPYISSDRLSYHPSILNAPCLPSSRERLSRCDELCITSASCKRQQNELSKQSEVWNGMEQPPFTSYANFEKQQHQTVFSQCNYCPADSRESTTSTKISATSDLTPTNTPLVSSTKFTASEIPAAFTLRPPHAAAQLTIRQFFQKSPAKMDFTLPEASTQTSNSIIHMDDFVPTAEIPELELTPSKEEEPKHLFDVSMRSSHCEYRMC